VGEGRRFFCCKTCLGSYKEKYGNDRKTSSGTDWNA